MTSDIKINLVGDEELLQILNGLDYRTQQIELKKVLRDTATKTFVKQLRREAPKGRTGNLRRSMGHVTGKSRKVATVFAGPRMSHNRRSKSGEMIMGHKGWVANILENAKMSRRKPLKGRTMVWAGRHFTSVAPISKKTDFKGTILRTIREAEDYKFKAMRTIFQREINKFKKR